MSGTRGEVGRKEGNDNGHPLSARTINSLSVSEIKNRRKFKLDSAKVKGFWVIHFLVISGLNFNLISKITETLN